jgi:hypothetical protein
MDEENKDLEYLERDQRVFDEKVEREGGVFVEPQPQGKDCNSEREACAPDDYPEDPYAVDNRPGTPDDAGYSFGLQTNDAADHHLIPEGRSHQSGPSAPGVEHEEELGQKDEDDLWRRMEPLVEEDVAEGIRMPEGVSEEQGERIIDAMGAEFTPEDQIDNSAIAQVTGEPDHGGFPDRDEGRRDVAGEPPSEDAEE